MGARLPSEGKKKRRVIEDWEANDALQTLKRAEEIKQDKPLMKAAVKAADKQQVALSKAAKAAKSATGTRAKPRSRRK